MRKIILHGTLKDKFGDEYQLEVGSPAEAIRALSVQLDGFEQYLMDSEKNGVGYKVIDGENISSTEDLNLIGQGDIHIVPVIGGANAEARILIGAALIAASFYIPVASPYLMNSGIAMAAGGAVEILTRGTRSATISEPEKNRPSYSFNGAVNTTQQGHPVPVGYGRLRVGGAVVSASLNSESTLAGYEYVDVETYRDVLALGIVGNYIGSVPPPNYFRSEIVETGFYDWGGQYWKHRFYYYEQVLQLRTV